MRWLLTLTTLALAAGAMAQSTASPAGSGTVVFQNVAVFDGEALLPPTTVVVEGGIITAVGQDSAVPDGAEIVDGSGKTLLPGLIDAHVHTFTPAMLQQAAVFGVTTVLDMFTDESFAAQMRAEQAAGPVTARADLLSAGTLATAPGGHGTQFGFDVATLTDPAQAAQWVADRVAAGADYIKVVVESGEEMGFSQPTLDEPTVRAVIEAAHAQNLLVVTHVQTAAAAAMVVAAGTDGLAHMFSDELPTQALIDAMVANHVFVIPTFTVFQSIGVDDAVDASLAADERMAPYLSPADLQSLGSPYHGFEAMSFEVASEGVTQLRAAGVRILAGTDAPNPGTAFGASMHRELELLTLAGLSPSEALAAATSVNADTFGLTDRGRVIEGQVADLVLVDGDPTVDITATRDIVTVYRNGVPIDRDSYRAALTAVQQAAADQAERLQGEGPIVVSDFEAGDLSVAFGSPWVATTDEQAGGDSTASIEVVEGGAGDSALSLAVSGTVGDAFALPWSGVMFMPGATPFGPADLSDRSTLVFAARSVTADDSTDLRIQLFCANSGQVPPEWGFEVTDEWQQYEVDLGTVGDCDPSGVMAIIFSASEVGEYAFQLDDVTVR
ncbi:MAG TPA: amidohydrolase family protein [Trueperaceae bacterium]|nr:amidohydrolase family protein [Trueperaceae bacterium]